MKIIYNLLNEYNIKYKVHLDNKILYTDNNHLSDAGLNFFYRDKKN